MQLIATPIAFVMCKNYVEVCARAVYKQCAFGNMKYRVSLFVFVFFVFHLAIFIFRFMVLLCVVLALWFKSEIA